MPRRIAIFDTTLRDGEQAPGFSMNLDEKLEVARQLARLGVDVIEAGYPVTSPGDFASVKEIARVVRGPVIASMARAVDREIDAAWEAVRGAERPRLHVVLATSAIHMEHRLRMRPDEVLELASRSVARAKALCPEVEFSAEDATRSDPGFLCAVLQAAIAAGAVIVNVPDTVGYAVPDEYAELIRRVRAGVPDIEKATLSAHCHDDLGLAVANTLAAIGAGAQQVECTMNGLGERAGNAALEELVMCMVTRVDVLRAYCAVDTTRIYATSKLVQAVTGVRPQPNKAVVGDNAFAHESSGHQAGLLADRSTYEIMTPESVGLQTSTLVLGKHSGRAAFEERIASLGHHPRPDSVADLFDGFKLLADKKKTVTDRDLEALVLGFSAKVPETYRLDRFVVNTGSAMTATSAVRLSAQNQGHAERSSLLERVSAGVGPIDASFRAIDKIVGTSPVLEDFARDTVTEGKDAQGEARVRIRCGERRYNGRGLSTDVVEAGIKAYIAAINAMAQDTEGMRESDCGS
jgi:2-isopropylmalate synthase